jgi:hypothetical protein
MSGLAIPVEYISLIFIVLGSINPMTLAETIYRHSLHLPEQAAQEALDFIEFLEQRYGTVRTAPKSAGDTEAFLARQ